MNGQQVKSLKWNSTFSTNKFLIHNTNKMKLISSFDEILIKDNSYILCDIDDTVLDYGEIIDNYWKSKIHDPMYNIWHQLIINQTPKLTDDNLHNFIENALNNNCEIHFITHRNYFFNQVTREHLKLMNLDNIPVHFLSGKSKGDYIRDNFSKKPAIFIDDSENNINDVVSKNLNVATYLFKKSS